MRTLIDRLHTAIVEKEPGFARESMEKIVAHTLAGKFRPYFARRSLITIAQYLRREVSADEAARVARYLDQQPLDLVTENLLDDFRKGLPEVRDVVLEPWSAASADRSRLPRICDPYASRTR